MSLRRFLALWGPVALYAAALYLASSRSQFPAVVALIWDKLLHAGAWAGLTVLALRATHRGKGPLRLGATFAAVALALAYGISDEFHQSFVPGREPSLADFAADSVGTAAAVAAVMAWRALVRRNMGRAPAV